MDTYIYKLRFKGPIHITSDPLSMQKPETIIHSDTLFSAVINSYSLLYDINESFIKNPPFLISSAFPFYEDRLFIKRPFVKLKIPKEDSFKFRKSIKNSKFIESSLFKSMLEGKGLSLSHDKFLEGGFIVASPIDTPVYKEFERPRSAISHINKSTIFYTNSIVFSEESGFYFFVVFKNQEEKRRFDSALYLLGDTGIGGKRSDGYGLFEFDVVSSERFINPFLEGEYFLALSLYYPTKEEIGSGILKGASFDFMERQNWIFSKRAHPLRSKSVRMFVEGSVFKSTGIEKGDIVDTTPEIVAQAGRLKHKVYRYGRLFKIMIPKSLVEANYD